MPFHLDYRLNFLRRKIHLHQPVSHYVPSHLLLNDSSSHMQLQIFPGFNCLDDYWHAGIPRFESSENTLDGPHRFVIGVESRHGKCLVCNLASYHVSDVYLL
jgi:hypothetical protein